VNFVFGFPGSTCIILDTMEEEPAFDPELVSVGDGLAAFGSSAGSEGRPPAINEHTKYDEQRQCWIYTNPTDGAQYKWDPVRQFYVADVRHQKERKNVKKYFVSFCAFCAFGLTTLLPAFRSTRHSSNNSNLSMEADLLRLQINLTYVKRCGIRFVLLLNFSLYRLLQPLRTLKRNRRKNKRHVTIRISLLPCDIQLRFFDFSLT
jgi:hypothetical protein